MNCMKHFAGFMAVMLMVTLGMACNRTEKSGEKGTGQKNVAVSLADTTDYYIGTMVGGAVAKAFEEAGAKVDVLDAGNQVNIQLQQIQNAAVKGADIIYVFPVGGADAYHDALVEARKAGVKVIVSNNDPGEGAFDVYVGAEELYMGAMAAAMLTDWIDNTLPGAKQVKTLLLEARFNDTMAHRCIGVRLISEKFLRRANLENMYFVRTNGPAVKYLDENGKEQSVDEPTGGLILDSKGYAILNPFYDSRVILIESANRTSTSVVATEAQAALEAAVTNGHHDIQAIITTNDTGISLSEKVIELSNAGALKNKLSALAVFGADLTEANREAILRSVNNATVLRGVMAMGDLVKSVCDYAAKMVRDEPVPPYTMEPLSYVKIDSTGKLVTVMYTDHAPISADSSEFF
jgi:ABC-type sugar transport system substrate-binding protein